MILNKLLRLQISIIAKEESVQCPSNHLHLGYVRDLCTSFIQRNFTFEDVHQFMYDIELHYMTINKHTFILYTFLLLVSFLGLRDLKQPLTGLALLFI